MAARRGGWMFTCRALLSHLLDARKPESTLLPGFRWRSETWLRGDLTSMTNIGWVVRRVNGLRGSLATNPGNPEGQDARPRKRYRSRQHHACQELIGAYQRPASGITPTQIRAVRARAKDLL
jgi:hypothetical protein